MYIAADILEGHKTQRERCIQRTVGLP